LQKSYIDFFLVKGIIINGIIMSNVNHATKQFNPPINPPVMLVQTWCLLCRVQDEEVSQHAMKMLIETFGDMQTVVGFVKKHHIRVG
jgi:hypothetical protein